MSTINRTPRIVQREGGQMSPGGLSGRMARTLDKDATKKLAEEQRQAMLENFDMEVEDKIRSMRVQLEADKNDLMLKADCEVAQLPKCVREMPLKTFLRDYGGDVPAAVRGALRLDIENSDELVSLPETPLAIRARRRQVQTK